MMKSKDFINKFKWLVNKVPTVYYSGTDWSRYDESKKAWNMDCVVSIKSILWGFSADMNKKKARGGAVYKSNGVADFTCDGALNYCTGVSTDFSNLTPGEYLCMKGSTNHAGVYLGNGKVYECTSAWEKKCLISDIDSKGNRSYKGKKSSYKWTYHGKLKYIDYSDQVEKTIEELAQEVLDGKHGNGDARKKSLGDKYRAVQDLVNELTKPILETKPIEEPKEEKINTEIDNINEKNLENSQKPDLYYEKDNNNALLHLIDFIIDLIKKIFKKD